MLARLTAVAVLLAGGPATAQDPATLAGSWKLNRGLSDDVAAKIKDAAGSQYMYGGPTWATDTWIPWGTSFKDDERVGLREFLLATAPALEAIEIEANAREIKTVHGEAGVRIFNLTRASSGTSGMSGETVTRQARFKGSQLILESRGKESLLTEVLSPVPSRSQLAYVLRLEQKLLKAPLELRLVYDHGEPAP